MTRTISASEYELWKTHPLFNTLLQHLDKVYKGISVEWAKGTYTKDSIDGTVQMNSLMMGKSQYALELMARLNEGRLDGLTVVLDEE
jgi:hypothetical protein